MQSKYFDIATINLMSHKLFSSFVSNNIMVFSHFGYIYNYQQSV